MGGRSRRLNNALIPPFKVQNTVKQEEEYSDKIMNAPPGRNQFYDLTMYRGHYLGGIYTICNHVQKISSRRMRVRTVLGQLLDEAHYEAIVR